MIAKRSRRIGQLTGEVFLGWANDNRLIIISRPRAGKNARFLILVEERQGQKMRAITIDRLGILIVSGAIVA